tara:strand:- start:467 stop:1360 length:894 start_codon:yes stop_codon:yes gene_type:complete
MFSNKKIKIIIGHLILFILFSCSDNILEFKDSSIEIINTIIDLNRFDNTLFLQLETYKNEFASNIKEVTIELSYIGNSESITNNKFELYDNGENGDIIPYNGIFTLLVKADTLYVPGIVPRIEDIILEKTFKLDKMNPDSLNILVTALGKPFRVTSTVLDSLDNKKVSVTNINIDNSFIELQINTDYMYLDNINTEICDRVFNNNPQEDAFESYFIWSNSIPSQVNPMLFLFNTKIPFRSINDCGGTGIAYLRFILHDLDTMTETISEDIELIIYGCGDGICESDYENTLNCSDDCN